MSTSHGTWSAAAALLLVPAAHAVDLKDPFDFFVADEYSYDDNLFRVPPDLPAIDSRLVDVDSLPGRSEDDYINRLSAGINLRSDAARQVFNLGLRLDDVRYQSNDYLDYIGGNAVLGWDWQLGSHWLGRVTGLYDRSQASFANYLLFARDLVDTSLYGLELRYRIGSRFALLGAGNVTRGDHSLAARRDQNFDGETARVGLEYRTPSDNLLALDYRTSHVEFGDVPNLPSVLRKDYDEDVPSVIVKYAFTVKTSLEARIGYLDRDYLDPAVPDYAGDIWSVAVRWEPRVALQFDLKAAHDLRAYSDAESDYFEVDLFSIGPIWKPTEQLSLTTAFTWEQQDYIGNGLLQSLVGARQDDVQSIKLKLDYQPRDMLAFAITYQQVERESNRAVRAYDNSLLGLQVKLTF